MIRSDPPAAFGVAAAALLLFGFAVRLHDGASNYLNPDEAMHIVVALQASLLDVHRHWNDFTHPPLLLHSLWAWLFLGTSEVVARLWLNLATLAAGWFGYLWLRRRWSDEAALLALAFWVASPGMIAAGSEIRQAGLLLPFAAAAMVALERCIESRQRRWMAVYTLGLVGSIGSHYGAAPLLVAFGLYAPCRLYASGQLRQLGPAWVVSQLVTLAWCGGLLYENGFSVRFARNAEYLNAFKFDPERETLLRFLARSTHGAMIFATGSAVVAYVAGGFVLVGLLRPMFARAGRAADALWLFVPLLLNVIGALVRYMPWGNTRHITAMLAVLGAAYGIGLATLLPRRRWLTLLAAGSTAGVLYLAAETPAERIVRPPADMQDLLRYLERQVRPQDLLVIDGGTYPVLAYYHRDQPPEPWPVYYPRVLPGTATRPQLLTVREWQFQADTWWPKVMDELREHDIPAGKHVWVLSVGWWFPHDLRRAVPPPLLLRSLSFGALRLLEVRYVPTEPGQPAGTPN